MALVNTALPNRPGHRDGNNPWNEAFSFTQEQYLLLRKLRPDLFDYGNAQTRRKRWIEFGQTSIGKAFRKR